MKREVGVIRSLYRYPVKSMAGESVAAVTLGWHGLEADRRFAFRRVNDTSGFPWLYAGRLPSLVRYCPQAGEADEWVVRTPTGATWALRDEALRAELSAAFKEEVQLMQLNHGMFDAAPLSLITTHTLATLEQSVGEALDERRFRPNLVVENNSGEAFPEAFPEDEWIGKLLVFGEADDAPAMAISERDERCGMVNLDPATGEVNPRILKTVVQLNQNYAGIYGAPFRCGRLTVGAQVFLVDV